MSHAQPCATLTRDECRAADVLGQYEDPAGREREIVAIRALGKGVVVVDQLGDGLDQRLVGLIDHDEPSGNTRVLAELYLADPTRGRCRSVNHGDLEGAIDYDRPPKADVQWDVALVDRAGATLQLRPVSEQGHPPAMRWTSTGRGTQGSDVVSLRDVIGALEDYEPAMAMTDAAVRHHERTNASTCALRGELKRMQSSPIVLNRGLREQVQRVVSTRELSMSEIAIRCGRTKDGGKSGDTSWLARRIGQLPEAGKTTATPWVHSDVLGLIARDGLGIGPLDVEVRVAVTSGCPPLPGAG
jgi:hypothetical protein